MKRDVLDAALRRQLRRKLGSRFSRRAGTKSDPKNHPKPRQLLAEAVVKWAQERGKDESR